MSEIPKRPVFTPAPRDFTEVGQRNYMIGFHLEEVAHEHAVAKVAVEALRAAAPNVIGAESSKAAFAALAKIEASRWKP